MERGRCAATKIRESSAVAYNRFFKILPGEFLFTLLLLAGDLPGEARIKEVFFTTERLSSTSNVGTFVVCGLSGRGVQYSEGSGSTGPSTTTDLMSCREIDSIGCCGTAVIGVSFCVGAPVCNGVASGALFPAAKLAARGLVSGWTSKGVEFETVSERRPNNLPNKVARFASVATGCRCCFIWSNSIISSDKPSSVSLVLDSHVCWSDWTHLIKYSWLPVIAFLRLASMSSTKYRSASSEDPVGGEEEEVPVVPVVAASIIRRFWRLF